MLWVGLSAALGFALTKLALERWRSRRAAVLQRVRLPTGAAVEAFLYEDCGLDATNGVYLSQTGSLRALSMRGGGLLLWDVVPLSRVVCDASIALSARDLSGDAGASVISDKLRSLRYDCAWSDRFVDETIDRFLSECRGERWSKSHLRMLRERFPNGVRTKQDRRAIVRASMAITSQWRSSEMPFLECAASGKPFPRIPPDVESEVRSALRVYWRLRQSFSLPALSQGFVCSKRLERSGVRGFDRVFGHRAFELEEQHWPKYAPFFVERLDSPTASALAIARAFRGESWL